MKTFLQSLVADITRNLRTLREQHNKDVQAMLRGEFRPSDEIKNFRPSTSNMKRQFPELQ